MNEIYIGYECTYIPSQQEARLSTETFYDGPLSATPSSIEQTFQPTSKWGSSIITFDHTTWNILDPCRPRTSSHVGPGEYSGEGSQGNPAVLNVFAHFLAFLCWLCRTGLTFIVALLLPMHGAIIIRITSGCTKSAPTIILRHDAAALSSLGRFAARHSICGLRLGARRHAVHLIDILFVGPAKLFQR